MVEEGGREGELEVIYRQNVFTYTCTLITHGLAEGKTLWALCSYSFCASQCKLPCGGTVIRCRHPAVLLVSATPISTNSIPSMHLNCAVCTAMPPRPNCVVCTVMPPHPICAVCTAMPPHPNCAVCTATPPHPNCAVCTATPPHPNCAVCTAMPPHPNCA